MSNLISKETLNEVREIQENRMRNERRKEMRNERHIETFEHWWLCNYGDSPVMSSIIRDVARSAWDYQQKTINELNAKLDNIE